MKSTNTEKQKSFQETQIYFVKCIEHQMSLDTRLQPLGGSGYHETIQFLTSRKRYGQKTSRCGTGKLNKRNSERFSNRDYLLSETDPLTLP